MTWKFTPLYGASIDTLFRRIRYGGRKGRSALRRLRPYVLSVTGERIVFQVEASPWCAGYMFGAAAAFGLIGMGMAIGGFKLVKFTMMKAPPISFPLEWYEEDVQGES